MYTGTKLIELLAKQERSRELFRQGEFALTWRAKVGSHPHPDVETLVSAGEPCGAWQVSNNGRAENKRNVGDNWQQLRDLPLNGYIPAASIRGIVRAWAMQRPNIKARMLELLGEQRDREITAGKIQFLDAWPLEPTKLTLDIVNPQQDFQVFHEGQSTPLSLYTLGNGDEEIDFKVAIRGIPGKATAADVEQVWGWVEQALVSHGVGSRTASGYGSITTFDRTIAHAAPPGWSEKSFAFSLYNQGCAGPNVQTMELRPSHWRGWLRSWLTRFLLGVMTQENAQKTLAELMGGIQPDAVQGKVRLSMQQGNGVWGEASKKPNFYCWKGQLRVQAPPKYLAIVLPVIRAANTLGSVGRGWRRPLHIFCLDNGYEAARGGYLSLRHKVRDGSYKPFVVPPTVEYWQQVYTRWQSAVKELWPERYIAKPVFRKAEVFSMDTCAIYAVPGPSYEPLDFEDMSWQESNPSRTRGEGMDLIYDPRYKRRNDVGGSAGGGAAYCSWVSIRRIPVRGGTKEIVCLFMGDRNNLRSQFLRDLANIEGAQHLFGQTP